MQLGLLRAADNESELASVIAHEIGHVVARHGARSLSCSKFFDAIGNIALGKNSSDLAQIASKIVKSPVLLVYSRQDELEADRIAIETLPRAGLNPEGMIWFFEKISKDRASGSSRVAHYFSTHPMTSDRIENAQEEIAALGNLAPGIADDSTAFERMKNRYPAGGK